MPRVLEIASLEVLVLSFDSTASFHSHTFGGTRHDIIGMAPRVLASD